MRLFNYSAKEQRTTLASLNLFFSALLGANLGTMNEIPLSEYFKMVLLLVGAVTAILMIAVSKRGAIVFRTMLVLLAVGVLATSGTKGVEREFVRLAITLSLWLSLLLLLRLTPVVGKEDAGSSLHEEF